MNCLEENKYALNRLIELVRKTALLDLEWRIKQYFGFFCGGHFKEK